MKALIAIAALISLSACGSMSRATAGLTGYSRECINHVSYLQFPSGVIIERDVNDKIVRC